MNNGFKNKKWIKNESSTIETVIEELDKSNINCIERKKFEDKLKIFQNRIVNLSTLFHYFDTLTLEIEKDDIVAKKISESPIFWTYIIRTLYNNIIIDIGAIYGGTRNKHSLFEGKFIKYVKDHKEKIFSRRFWTYYYTPNKKKIFKRKEINIKLTFDEILDKFNNINNEIEEIKNKCFTWRKKFVAHIDEKAIENEEDIINEARLGIEDLRLIVDKTNELFNLFSVNYNDTYYSNILLDRNDIFNVFK